MAFPTNQFGHQENSNGQEILNSLKYVRPGNGYEPKCIMFDKVYSLTLRCLECFIWPLSDTSIPMLFDNM